MKVNKVKQRQNRQLGLHCMTRKGNGDIQLKHTKHIFYLTSLFERRIKAVMKTLPLEQREAYKNLALERFKETVKIVDNSDVVENRILQTDTNTSGDTNEPTGV